MWCREMGYCLTKSISKVANDCNIIKAVLAHLLLIMSELSATSNKEDGQETVGYHYLRLQIIIM